MSVRSIITIALTLLALGPVRGSVQATQPHPSSPVLWAWERPEDLRFAGSGVTIAMLAGSIRLTSDSVLARPRLQPALVDPQQRIIGVVHVDIERPQKPAWTDSQRQRAVTAAVRLLANPRFEDWQVDFEVRASERHILLDLLTDLRARMPAGKRLSMTALASWCQTETWLETAPVDDIVPMMFRMGLAGAPLQARLVAGEDWRNPRCRGVIGVAADAPPSAVPPARQIWIFNPHLWTAADLAALRGRLGI